MPLDKFNEPQEEIDMEAFYQDIWELGQKYLVSSQEFSEMVAEWLDTFNNDEEMKKDYDEEMDELIGKD